MAQPLMVDTHVHVASTDLERYPVAQTSGSEDHWIHDRPLPIEQLVAAMDAAGVAKAVIVQPGPMLADNRYVVDSAHRYPSRIVPVCVVEEFAPNVGEQLEYWVRQQGAAGVRLSVVPYAEASGWLGDAKLGPCWEAAKRLGIPVCIHVRWNGLHDLQTALKAHPDVPVALDHLAHVPLDDGPPFRAAQPLLDLAALPNLSLKVTTHALTALAKQPTGPAPFVEQLVRAYGARRLTWGSNAPRSAGSYAELAALGRAAVATLSDADAEWLLGKTAESLYPGLAG